VDWIIRLAANNVSTEDSDLEDETSFYNEFTKNRDDGGHEESMDLTFVTEDGKANVNWKLTDLETRVYELIKSGVESNADIAQELDITTGTVSKCAKKLMNDNFIKKEGQQYVISYDHYPR
jgi:DNA-binding NarL/FixJ family response regulator